MNQPHVVPGLQKNDPQSHGDVQLTYTPEDPFDNKAVESKLIVEKLLIALFKTGCTMKSDLTGLLTVESPKQKAAF